jgi:hypothetical protein
MFSGDCEKMQFIYLKVKYINIYIYIFIMIRYVLKVNVWKSSNNFAHRSSSCYDAGVILLVN